MVCNNQKLLLSRYFSRDGENNAWIVYQQCISPIPELAPQYHTNTEEADVCGWRHEIQIASGHVLIYSPDTDV